MPSTRSSTGSSRPRIHTTIEAPTRPTTKKRGVTKTTTTKGTKTGRVTKKAPATHHKRKSHLKDKIEGVGLKAEGAITGREGKKAAGTKKIRGTDGKKSRAKKI